MLRQQDARNFMRVPGYGLNIRQNHEYHFLNDQIPLFHVHAVQI